MSNVLPIRFMTEEQYNELRTNGTVTGNGHTITDIENALNITPDMTDQKIAALNAEIAKLKDQVANVGKVYRHSITIRFDDQYVKFNLYTSKETAFTLGELSSQYFTVGAYYFDNYDAPSGVGVVESTTTVMYLHVNKFDRTSNTLKLYEVNLLDVNVNVNDYVTEI